MSPRAEQAVSAWRARRVEDRFDDDEEAFACASGDIEAGLAAIDFPEVTREDRVTFLVLAAVWQARCARAAGRYDLAFALVRYCRDRIADIEHES